jgi:hypothetical protein
LFKSPVIPAPESRAIARRRSPVCCMAHARSGVSQFGLSSASIFQTAGTVSRRLVSGEGPGLAIFGI